MADELLISVGTGAQTGSNQHNDQIAVDCSFYQHDRSDRPSISFGIGYTKIQSDTSKDAEIEVYTIYPQLTLIPVRLLPL